jgi:hypothetical protein
MYTVYRGATPVDRFETRSSAIQAARSLSSESHSRVVVLGNQGTEMLRYRRGSLETAERLTRSDLKRGRKLTVHS